MERDIENLVIPQHVALILDGNGRWAKKRGLPRTVGHKQGCVTVEQTVEDAARLGIRYLTVYGFSTENWKRSAEEVGALMQLFVQDAGMIATGAQMLRWQVYTAAFGGVVLLLTVLFQATGKIIPSFLLSISRQGVVFLLALVVCVHLFQYQGVLMAQAVADILSAALALGLLAASRDIIAKQ